MNNPRDTDVSALFSEDSPLSFMLEGVHQGTICLAAMIAENFVKRGIPLRSVQFVSNEKDDWSGAIVLTFPWKRVTPRLTWKPALCGWSASPAVRCGNASTVAGIDRGTHWNKPNVGRINSISKTFYTWTTDNKERDMGRRSVSGYNYAERKARDDGYVFSGHWVRYYQRDEAKERAAKFREEGYRARMVDTGRGVGVYIKDTPTTLAAKEKEARWKEENRVKLVAEVASYLRGVADGLADVPIGTLRTLQYEVGKILERGF